MRKLDKEHLTWYIRELLHLEKDITIISDGNVTHLEVKGVDFYFYIKSLTYAGKPYPLNTTRAQLPQREEFGAIKASNAVFLFLGYDEKNEVFACWDPIRTKERLNEKQYVSFFSRLNLQESVSKDNIVESSLSNDFRYVLFNINDLAFFLLNICNYFPNLNLPSAILPISEKVEGVLSKVEDDTSIKLLVDEMYAHDPNVPILSVVYECMNEYGEYYHRLTLKDWYHLVDKYLKSKITDSYDMVEFLGKDSSVADPIAEPVPDD